jgi:septum formation protein
MAVEKARAGRALLQRGNVRGIVLGADTAVLLDGQILGKPRNREEGLSTLARLSGRTHLVCSAVASICEVHEQVVLNTSKVTFRPLSPSEQDLYWLTGEPADKAGAYAIQGYAAAFIVGLEGSYSGVMGLPLYETAQLLAACGLPLFHDFGTRELPTAET